MYLSHYCITKTSYQSFQTHPCVIGPGWTDVIECRACLQICEIVIFAPRKHTFDTLDYSPQDADYIQDNIPFIRPPPICIHRPRADPELNTLQKYQICTLYHKMYCAPICIPQPRAELNSQMQKRLSCSFRLVSRFLNFPVSLWRLHTFCPIFC